MRRVSFVEHVPNPDFDPKIPRSNENRPKQEIESEGWFHGFFNDPEDTDPTALIERDNGEVQLSSASAVKFIDQASPIKGLRVDWSVAVDAAPWYVLHWFYSGEEKDLAAAIITDGEEITCAPVSELTIFK